MRELVVFNQVSLDGYFVDRSGDMSWAKGGNDAEFNSFTEENAKGGGTLVFGRITYELMASFWPTPQASEMMPVVAERMNGLPKVVFSKTMNTASWQNTRLVKNDPAAEMRKMKSEPGDGLCIMGSGTIVSRLASEGLVDEYQLVVIPIVLGGGRTMFEGVEKKLNMKLKKSRTFRNGKVFLCYAPA
jgi:dihydrofolate reductase